MTSSLFFVVIARIKDASDLPTPKRVLSCVQTSTKINEFSPQFHLQGNLVVFAVDISNFDLQRRD